MEKRKLLINELKKHIIECNRKLDFVISDINTFGDELTKLCYETSVTKEIGWENFCNYTTKEKTKIDSLLEKLFKSNDFIEQVEKRFKDSNIKFYLNDIMKNYANSYYNMWKYANKLNNKIFANVKKEALSIVDSPDINLTIEKYFKLTYEMLRYINNSDKKHYTYSLASTWLFGFIVILIRFREDFEYVKENYINQLKTNLIEIENLVFNQKYIDKSVFKNLKSYSGDYKCLDMEEEYSKLMKLIVEYKNTFKDKQQKETQIRVSSTLETKREVLKAVTLTREERIERYNESKIKSVYIDESIDLSSNQINVIADYAKMVKENAEDDVDTLLELLPYDKFDDEKQMLKEIINRLKEVNVNHNTNEVLIFLNKRLKEQINKACKRKIKKGN